MLKEIEIEDVEIELLLEGIFRVYGYDFRDYARASLKRRLKQWLSSSGFRSFSEAAGRVLRRADVFTSLLEGVTVNVSEMFRDPGFFLALRNSVAPHLKTYPFVKIWVVGCSAGEEAYSVSIIMREEGLSGRFRIYATDINEKILKRAEEAVYPLSNMKQYTRAYQQSGGKHEFSDYYTAKYDRAVLSRSVGEDIVFAAHNLVSDAGLGEMQMILCRNLLIYFQPPLKDRALKLLDDSLVTGGFLCLGMKETLSGREISPSYFEIVRGMRIYRKGYA